MKQRKPLTFLLRVGVYCLGLLLLAFGVAFSVNCNLGASPVSALPYVVSRIVNMPLGTCTTLVFCGYVLLQILILGREFRPVDLLQVLVSTIFGYFVDFAKFVVGDFTLPAYFGKLVMLGISIVLIALGVLLYVEAHLVPLPMEGVSFSVAKKLNKPFPATKTVIDCVVVLTAVGLSFLFFGRLDGIREGTIITAMVVGKLVGILKKPLGPILRKLCFGCSN